VTIAPFGTLPGLDLSPESDRQLARERDDHDALDATLEVIVSCRSIRT
jgi:hypothetical protein